MSNYYRKLISQDPNYYRKLILQDPITWKIETREFFEESLFESFLTENTKTQQFHIVHCLFEKCIKI